MNAIEIKSILFDLKFLYATTVNTIMKAEKTALPKSNTAVTCS